MHPHSSQYSPRVRTRRAHSLSVSLTRPVGFFTILDEDPLALRTALGGVGGAAAGDIDGRHRESEREACGVDETEDVQSSKRTRLGTISKVLKGFPRRTKSSSRTLPAEWSALSEVGGHPYTPKTPENSVATTTSSNLTTRDLRVSISQSKSFGSSVSHYTHNSESVAHPTEHTELPFPRESICNYFVRPKRNPAAKFNANPFDSETSLAKSNFMKRCSLPAATNKDALRSASVRMRRQSNYYLNSTRTPRASEASDLHVARNSAVETHDRLLEALDFAYDPVLTINENRFAVPSNKPGVYKRLSHMRASLMACHIDNDLFWVDLNETTAVSLSENRIRMNSTDTIFEDLEYGFSHSLRSLSGSPRHSVFSQLSSRKIL